MCPMLIFLYIILLLFQWILSSIPLYINTVKFINVLSTFELFPVWKWILGINKLPLQNTYVNCIWTHSNSFLCVCVWSVWAAIHASMWRWHWIFSWLTLHFIYWGKVSHLNPQFIHLACLTIQIIVGNPCLSASGELGFQVAQMLPQYLH